MSNDAEAKVVDEPKVEAPAKRGAKAKGRALATATCVDGTEYVAGDVPSAEHAKRITNPAAWGD